MKGLALLLFLVDPAPDTPAPPTPAQQWAAHKTPGHGAPRAIGKYGAGCLDGAARLPMKGTGFFVTRPERERVFGHPLLVQLIETIGAQVAKLHQALPIGDLSQARGGPAPTGHASHQTGLDVDIWYLPPENGKSPPVVDVDKHVLTKKWKASIAKVLQSFAEAGEVDRIFVNPVIKRALCTAPPTAPEEDRSWLKKIRPWWGHHDHFHVRLACPKESTLCEAQTPLPDGDGCKGLDWWFAKHTDEEREKGRKDYQAKVGASPPLPTPCQTLLDENE
jgi:penicillin-insensitive murein endopeptidase